MPLGGTTTPPTGSDPLDARIATLASRIQATESHLAAVSSGAKQYRDAAGFTTLYESPGVYRRELVELRRELADARRAKLGLFPQRLTVA